jgi:hypothetical protein
MPDDRSKRGGQERTRIDVNQHYELRDWADKFGVCPEEIKNAVKVVGDQADAVETHLKLKHS